MKRILFLFTILSVILTISTLGQAAVFIDGLYQIQGKNSLHGEYIGQAWISGGQVQRLIEWKSLRYRNYAIQSIWTGVMTNSEPRFELALSTVLTGFEDFHPSAAELNARIPVTLRQDPSTEALTFEVANEGTYQETWHRFGAATQSPLWVNRRKQFEGLGKSQSVAVQLAKVLGINQVMDWYRSQPETQAYRKRPEFKEGKQFFIEDHTDSDFYALTPGVLRLANRTLNPLAFAEALMRRNAYGPTLAEKAEILREETLRNNLNAAGMLESVRTDSQGQKLSRLPEYDGCLWTAMLGWAEVLRYQTTQDPQALKNFRQILSGILTLVEITENPKQFARTLAISEPSENLGEGWVQGKGPYAHLKWRSGGNNDMMKGLFITLALAHQVPLSEDPELLQRVAKVARALPQLDIAHDGGSNESVANGLAALWTKDPAALATYYKRLSSLKSLAASVFGVDAGVYYGGIADWSGVQLTMVSTLSEILLATELQKTFTGEGDRASLAKARDAAESRLLETQQVYRPAHRDFLTVMTYAYSAKARASADLKDQAKVALWTLKEVPAPRSIGAGSVELPLRSEWCMSSWPRVPWKGLTGVRKLRSDIHFSTFASGVYSYPHFETNAWGSVYLWKDSPFSLKFGAESNMKIFSSDYLLVYWAARSVGLATADN
jgi:hypothetical protein